MEFGNQHIRITPAYAGKSSRDRALKRAHEDHPRLRGEKYDSSLKGPSNPGSPPLTRGKGVVKRFLGGGKRITPAYAGKRAKRRILAPVTQDHPRLRGEKFCF